MLHQNSNGNFPQTPAKPRFEPDYSEEETDNYSDLVRVTDER
jgi:hypothetical protein